MVLKDLIRNLDGSWSECLLRIRRLGDPGRVRHDIAVGMGVSLWTVSKHDLDSFD